MKMKRKLIVFYTVVILLYAGTPVFTVMYLQNNEKLKTEVIEKRALVEKKNDLSPEQKKLLTAGIDKNEVFLKSKKNLWIRGALLFSLAATGLLMYKGRIFPKEEAEVNQDE